MADKLHVVCDLVSGNDAASFAFGSDLWGHLIVFCFEDSSLMQADCGSVEVHVEKDDIRIVNTSRQPQLGWQRKQGIQQDVVEGSMTLPEFPVQIVVIVFTIRPVQMRKITTNKAGHQNEGSK